jgi:hypothetical protein
MILFLSSRVKDVQYETPSFCTVPSLLSSLAWVELDDVRLVKQIPVDKWHNAKVDYTRVHEMLR